MRTAIHGDRPVVRRYVTPAVAIVIPGTVAIMVVPIRAERECDDRNADLYSVAGHQDALALIFLLKEISGDPPAIVPRCDIAPRPAVDAAFDGDRRAGAQHRDAWIT